MTVKTGRIFYTALGTMAFGLAAPSAHAAVEPYCQLSTACIATVPPAGTFDAYSYRYSPYYRPSARYEGPVPDQTGVTAQFDDRDGSFTAYDLPQDRIKENTLTQAWWREMIPPTP